MRSILFIFFILRTLLVYGQNDTTIYFSNTQKTTSSSKAAYYSRLTKKKKGEFSLKDYYKSNDKWTSFGESNIRRLTDTSYLVIGSNYTYIRSFEKNDSSYYINDYRNSKLVSSGPSKTLFPLVKIGHWFEYSEGILTQEADYIDNQCITNICYLPGGTSLNNVFVFTDTHPQYEGGEVALLRFISENTEYPPQARDRGITGRVIIRFIVTKDATITGIYVLQSVTPILDKAAIKVVQQIPNKWIPAKIGNEKVNSFMMVPIIFSIK